MDSKKIIEKIKKLLALASCEGASDAEVQMAVSQSRKLMDKHNISMADIAGNGEDIVSIGMFDGSKRLSKWKNPILIRVATLNDCVIYVKNEYDSEKGRLRGYEFHGHESDVDIAILMANFLVARVENLAMENKNLGIIKGVSEINSYKRGVAKAISERLDNEIEQRKKNSFKSSNGMPTVVERLEIVKREINFSGYRKRKSTIVSQEAYQAGKVDGENVRINNFSIDGQTQLKITG